MKLQQHFGQANADIDQILISTDKVVSRSRKIETLDLEESTPATIEHPAPSAPAPAPISAPEPGPGFAQLRKEAAERRRSGGYRQPDLLAKES